MGHYNKLYGNITCNHIDKYLLCASVQCTQTFIDRSIRIYYLVGIKIERQRDVEKERKNQCLKKKTVCFKLSASAFFFGIPKTLNVACT